MKKPTLTTVTKYGLIGAAVLVLILWLKGCFTPPLPPAFNQPLPTDTSSQIVVESRHIAIRTPTESRVGYVPESGSAVAEVKTNGTINLRINNKGFTVRPVIGFMVTDRLRLAGGLQVGYWNRFELYLGGAGPHIIGFVAGGYRLDQIKYLQNTSVYVAYTTDKYIGTGLMLRF